MKKSEQFQIPESKEDSQKDELKGLEALLFLVQAGILPKELLFALLNKLDDIINSPEEEEKSNSEGNLPKIFLFSAKSKQNVADEKISDEALSSVRFLFNEQDQCNDDKDVSNKGLSFSS